jgi:3-oxoacyl-[acyl-carrier protein] reductase
MQIDLAGKVIFISGGTSVIGRAIVTECLRNNARVFFTYKDNRTRARALERKGATALGLDLTDRSAIKDLGKKIAQESLPIDLLINNAAAVRDKTIVTLGEDDWDTVLEINVTASVFLVKEFLPFLYKSKNAKILMIASQVGLHGAFGQANYAASKGAILSVTKSLAKELGKKKILVNALNPGFIRSPMTDGIPEKVKRDNLRRSCLASYGDTKEVADFVVYYASECVSKVSGQIFSLDSRIL